MIIYLHVYNNKFSSFFEDNDVCVSIGRVEANSPEELGNCLVP